jgi:hypothetical protein
MNSTGNERVNRDADVEKAPHDTGAPTAMRSSSAAAKRDELSQDTQPSTLPDPQMGSFQEPQIETWRLVSLYVR